MTHRAARVFLVVAALSAAGGAGYFLWQLDVREAALRQAAARYDAEAERALLLTERLRGAQQSYVAEGQGTQFWMTRATETLDQLERSVTTLSGTAPAIDLRDAARAAAPAIEELRRMDRRAREWIRAGDRLMASDLIFTEILTASGTLGSAVAAVRDRQQQVLHAELSAIRQQQLYAASAAAAVCLIATLLLAPAVRVGAPRDTREALRALLNDGAPAGNAPLRSDGPRAQPEAMVRVPAPAPVAPAPQAGTAARARRIVDVPGTARLCADLARVLDPADLPRLMASAAGLLDARGLIVWVGDRTGETLYPMLSHGYASAAVSRMGGLHRTDDNAAAQAFRRGESAILPARNGVSGAIVTPIVSPEGCVGVLTVEIADLAEEDEERRALAGILAAQLATLVTALPPSDRALQAQG